jgi:hypothetical protein
MAQRQMSQPELQALLKSYGIGTAPPDDPVYQEGPTVILHPQTPEPHHRGMHGHMPPETDHSDQPDETTRS